VKIGSSCAAVTGYDFPKTNRRTTGGEGRKEGKPEVRTFVPPTLIRAAARADGSTKLLRRKEE
jgi:hypothetical protein